MKMSNKEIQTNMDSDLEKAELNLEDKISHLEKELKIQINYALKIEEEIKVKNDLIEDLQKEKETVEGSNIELEG